MNKAFVFLSVFVAKKINMKKRLLVIITLLLFITASSQLPKTFLIDPYRLLEVKKKVQQKDKSTLQLMDSLKKQANSLLNMKAVSVMDKAFTPVSGSKHDYMSQAPYFWYDSSKPNGLPYMRKDGVRNPEINKITDHRNLDELGNAAKILSLAFYFTGDEKYAGKAGSLLRYWFFNEATKMNPNLEFAQAVPGVNTGRGIGIIETRSLTGIVDAVGLLDGSKSWKEKDTKALQQWYAQYLNWMLTSKNGNDEHAAKNNHGTWFYVQAVDFALFTGDKEKAKKLVSETKARLDSQMTKEGKMPLELERTNALGYSTMNLRGWFDLARISENVGTDLWRYKNANQASLQTALDWLTPYALGEKKWDYQQISRYNKNEIYTLLLQASDKFNDRRYESYIKQGNDWMVELLYKK
jgi:hypothetical protein